MLPRWLFALKRSRGGEQLFYSSMWERDITASSFLLRKLVILSEETHKHQKHVACIFCNNPSTIVEHEGNHRLACKHLEQCTECREYQIEKIFRCPECCKAFLDHVPEHCSETCSRREFTQKSTALCGICNSHLQKECKMCKRSQIFRHVKNSLKKRVFVFVRSPPTVSAHDNRPCSHYALCKYCNKNIARGHKGNSVCKLCRNQGSSQTPLAKAQSTFSINLNSPVPLSSSLQESLASKPPDALLGGKRLFEQTSPPLPVIKKQRTGTTLNENFYDIPAMKILEHRPPNIRGPLVSAYLHALAGGLGLQDNTDNIPAMVASFAT